MAKLKLTKIRESTVDEVKQSIRDLETELFNLKFRLALRQLDNALQVREKRRELARLKTILREHEKGIFKLAGGEPESS
jgi:large subunit ribosomal protein L29